MNNIICDNCGKQFSTALPTDAWLEITLQTEPVPLVGPNQPGPWHLHSFGCLVQWATKNNIKR